MGNFEKFLKALPAIRNYSGDRALFGGGNKSGARVNSIEVLSLRRLSNSSDFGDINSEVTALTATSNGVNNRGIFAGGQLVTNATVNNIDYIQISGVGTNATDFGDLTVDRCIFDSTSNKTNQRAVFMAGQQDGDQYTPFIDYITVNTPSNAITFGNLLAQKHRNMCCSNAENDRGISAGGSSGGDINQIEYITISSIGNSSDYGDLIAPRRSGGSTDNGVNNRGIFGGGGTYSGGWTYYNIIDYLNLSSLSNSIDFGDLIVEIMGVCAASNGIKNRAVWAGGETPGVNIIQYVNTTSLSNAQDYGDLTAIGWGMAAAQNA